MLNNLRCYLCMCPPVYINNYNHARYPCLILYIKQCGSKISCGQGPKKSPCSKDVKSKWVAKGTTVILLMEIKLLITIQAVKYEKCGNFVVI